jgi:hypothetical protein
MSMMGEGQAAPLSDSDKVLVWSTLSARRTSYENMMWQTPGLGMTAQAFLLTLALGPDTTSVARLLASTLSIAISLMVVQLMAKHRRFEVLDTLALEQLEREMGFDLVVGRLPHSKGRYASDHLVRADQITRVSNFWPRKFWKASSFTIWTLGQLVFVLWAVVIVVLVATNLDGLLSH